MNPFTLHSVEAVMVLGLMFFYEYRTHRHNNKIINNIPLKYHRTTEDANNIIAERNANSAAKHV